MAKKKVSKWSKSELIKLRNSLPTGWSETLATKHNLSPGTVENIIYGNAVNDDVVLSAIELAQNFKREIQSSKEAIKAL